MLAPASFWDSVSMATPKVLNQRLNHALENQHYGRARQICNQIARRIEGSDYPPSWVARHLGALRRRGRFAELVTVAEAYAAVAA